ncbi:MAG: ABC transporter permease [Methanocorpusculum sp.]|nr:ABC transporter permease [Methanocorpusculum sp.]MDE2518983.1 ABC transporter permease [Methanocorpusculum sp.]MDE2522426.1 ABC transporter permease [Methanocorpusculum sp.]MDE2523876.1 ABC transporter permease [Methanocorpusculum sp.]
MKWYFKLILPALFIVAWEIAAILIDNAFVLPRVGDVFAIFATPFADMFSFGSLAENSIISIYRVSLGFIITCVIAVPLGILLGRYQALEDFSDGLIQILRPIPPIAWVPLSLAWFGIGLASIEFIIVIGCIFPILVNTIDGVKRVKKSWIETARIYQAREWQVMSKVIVPAAGPAIWSGLRVGFGIAWMSVVAAEMLPGTTQGLGYLIMQTYGWGQVQAVIAGMIAIGIIGIVMDQFFQYVQRRKFGWEALDK